MLRAGILSGLATHKFRRLEVQIPADQPASGTPGANKDSRLGRSDDNEADFMQVCESHEIKLADPGILGTELLHVLGPAGAGRGRCCGCKMISQRLVAQPK